MILAIYEILPSTNHNYYIWHLRKNLDKNLRGQFRKNYNKFVKAWNKCQNFFSEYEFQKRWRELLTGFLAAKKYLKRALRLVVKSSATLFELDTHIQSLLNKEENLNSMNNQIKIQQWITIDEGQDEDGEDDEDYEDGEDGEDGDYGDDDDNDEQSDDEEQSDDKE
ncbi:hypothetical protein RhiirC2_793585 [Rhizophagus irregularis]|uniref:Protein FAR1-RELATED SEQUENCE n=1 Tax=Rhizophagus irregularis TaxID=588596 RepID=A0A2N1MF48_9GLOM|nr:hypothetical protein RhiirC2_793585 [Rhizophagus irregularis]